MKIFHIIAPDNTSETYRRFTDLVSGFASLGIKQQVLMAANEQQEARFDALGIPFHTQKFNGIFDLRTQQAAQQIAEAFGPHIIQTHSPDATALAYKINYNAIRLGFAHDDRDKNKKVQSMCDLVLSVQYEFNGQPLDYDIIPVPPLVCAPNSDIPPANRSDYDTPDDCPLVGTMVDLAAPYDVEKILQAIREIPDLRFWLIGNSEKQSHFQNKARKYGVHDKLRFISDTEDWPALIKALDLCVVPFRQKGTDRLTLEAWACGTCVLSGMPGGNSPITNGEDGKLVEGNDGLKWREYIKELLAAPEETGKLAQAGKARYERSHTADKVVRGYLQSYETAFKIKV